MPERSVRQTWRRRRCHPGCGRGGPGSLRGQTGGSERPSDGHRGVDLQHDGMLGRDLTEGAQDREPGSTEGGDGREVEACPVAGGALDQLPYGRREQLEATTVDLADDTQTR